MRYSETLKSRPSRGQIEASDSSNSSLHLRSTMKLTSSLTTIVSLLALSVSAAKRPDNAPDGIYIEVVHANGTTVMEYYGPANTTAPAYALDKRDKDQGYPVCQRPAMARSDIVAAVNGLNNFFGGGNAFYGKSVSNYHGGAVAYGCNYGNGQSMDAGRFNDMMNSLDTSCGNTHAGYFDHPGWKSSYGRAQSSSSFC